MRVNSYWNRPSKMGTALTLPAAAAFRLSRSLDPLDASRRGPCIAATGDASCLIADAAPATVDASSATARASCATADASRANGGATSATAGALQSIVRATCAKRDATLAKGGGDAADVGGGAGTLHSSDVSVRCVASNARSIPASVHSYCVDIARNRATRGKKGISRGPASRTGREIAAPVLRYRVGVRPLPASSTARLPVFTRSSRARNRELRSGSKPSAWQT